MAEHTPNTGTGDDGEANVTPERELEGMNSELQQIAEEDSAEAHKMDVGDNPIERLQSIEVRKLSSPNVEAMRKKIRVGMNVIMNAHSEQFEALQENYLQSPSGVKEITQNVSLEELQSLVPIIHAAATTAHVRQRISTLVGESINEYTKSLQSNNAEQSRSSHQTRDDPNNAVGDQRITHEKGFKASLKRAQKRWNKSLDSVIYWQEKVYTTLRTFVFPKSKPGAFNFFDKNFFLWKFFTGRK